MSSNKKGGRPPMKGGKKGRPTIKVTREQAADLLNVTREKVRNLERRGLLRPYPDCSGVVRYERTQIDTVGLCLTEQRKLGKLDRPFITRVFEMFDNEWPHNAVMASTKLVLKQVLQLHRQWTTDRTTRQAGLPSPSPLAPTGLKPPAPSLAEVYEKTMREVREAQERRMAAHLDPKKKK